MKSYSILYPERRASRPFSAHDLWRLPRVGAPVPSPDGSSLVVPVRTYEAEGNEGRTRLWHAPSEGGEPRPLTSPDTSSSSPAFSPDGTRLAFLRKGKNGKEQVWLMPLHGGEAECLTDLPLDAFDPRYLPDGSGIVFGAYLLKGFLTKEATKDELARREKDPVKAHVTEERVYRYWDRWLTTGEVPHLFLLDVATRATRDLTPQSTDWFDFMEPAGQYDISHDGREIAYAAIHFDAKRSLLRQAIHVVPIDPAAGGPRCLTPDHPADDHRPRYTPDGKGILYGMQHDPFFYADRVRLMRYDRATGAHAEVLSDWKLSPSAWEIAADGTVYLEAEDRARVSLFGWRGVGLPWTVVVGGSVGNTRPASSGRLVFTIETLIEPPEVHGCDASGRNVERLTRFTEPMMAEVSMGEVREYHYTGAKGAPVQMFVIVPPGLDPARGHPLLHVIHGGPHGISADGFHFRWNAQALAAPGHVTALVNFQGSTSWGQEFAEVIQGDWAERPYEDIMRATDLLIEEGIADPARMAAAGGSYGGYMAAWIAGHTDRFRCIVNHAGVFDTLAEYGCDVTQGRARAFGGEPWDGLPSVDSQNPVRFASGFKTPMLVIHGHGDYRVPADQALECYGILKAKGVPARLCYFPDENHWVLKRENSLLWYREVLAWLARFIG